MHVIQQKSRSSCSHSFQEYFCDLLINTAKEWVTGQHPVGADMEEHMYIIIDKNFKPLPIHMLSIREPWHD